MGLVMSGPRILLTFYMALETITGQGGWMDQVLVLDRPCIENGFIYVGGKPGLSIELNPDVVRAHLAPGETCGDKTPTPAANGSPQDPKARS